jgi:hypothetical protein
MKRLVVLLTMLAVFGLCAPSYGYILVYNVTSTMKAVDTAIEELLTMPVKGYLVLDYNETDDEVTDSSLVLYGKVGSEKLFVTVTDVVDNYTESGDYRIAELSITSNPGNHDTTKVVGKEKEKDIGLSEDEFIATSLKGYVVFNDGALVDPNDVLQVGGTVTFSLQPKKTKTANIVADTVDDVINDLTSALILKGYRELIL